ncbi:hypothetical protein ANN_21060 [Periplaneta americana]|uniref:Uncharacterized protein n=1 Tax=Periplaneta americana TaxID=6978 RepID=A0ABQ8SFH5_PERAM|nr:hypothetical protein ANN_21060 [Periplaneta americana]
MAGLCEGGNEPPGSLKASKVDARRACHGKLRELSETFGCTRPRYDSIGKLSTVLSLRDQHLSKKKRYPAFAHIGLRKTPENLNQVTCPDRESNPTWSPGFDELPSANHYSTGVDTLTYTGKKSERQAGRRTDEPTDDGDRHVQTQTDGRKERRTDRQTDGRRYQRMDERTDEDRRMNGCSISDGRESGPTERGMQGRQQTE